MWSIDDISFNEISSQRFEELCYDLLEANGFRNLSWRQGGADSGRDIEGYSLVSNGIAEDFEEKWFFECKKYAAGVPPVELHSKIAWADALRPRHFVIFVSSYITQGAREWVEKIRPQKQYLIHVIDGKRIKTLLSKSPEVFMRYFPSSRKILVESAMRQWVESGNNPNHRTLLHLVQSARPVEYTMRENAFIFIKSRGLVSTIEPWLTPQDMHDYAYSHLKDVSNVSDALLDKTIYKKVIETSRASSLGEVEYFYAIVNIDDDPRHECEYLIYALGDEGLEILLKKNEESVDVRFIKHSARAEVEAAVKILRVIRVATPVSKPDMQTDS